MIYLNKQIIYDFRYAPLWDDPLMQFHNHSSKMRVARSKYVPPVPTNLTALAQTLENYYPMKDFYRGCAVGADNSIGLIFIHNRMLQPLSECKQLFADGTFDVRHYYYEIISSFDFNLLIENYFITDET